MVPLTLSDAMALLEDNPATEEKSPELRDTTTPPELRQSTVSPVAEMAIFPPDDPPGVGG